MPLNSLVDIEGRLTKDVRTREWSGVKCEPKQQKTVVGFSMMSLTINSEKKKWVNRDGESASEL